MCAMEYDEPRPLTRDESDCRTNCAKMPPDEIVLSGSYMGSSGGVTPPLSWWMSSLQQTVQWCGVGRSTGTHSQKSVAYCLICVRMSPRVFSGNRTLRWCAFSKVRSIVPYVCPYMYACVYWCWTFPRHRLLRNLEDPVTGDKCVCIIHGTDF